MRAGSGGAENPERQVSRQSKALAGEIQGTHGERRPRAAVFRSEDHPPGEAARTDDRSSSSGAPSWSDMVALMAAMPEARGRPAVGGCGASCRRGGGRDWQGGLASHAHQLLRTRGATRVGLTADVHLRLKGSGVAHVRPAPLSTLEKLQAHGSQARPVDPGQAGPC